MEPTPRAPPPTGEPPPRKHQPLVFSAGEGGHWNRLRKRLRLDGRQEMVAVLLVGAVPLLVADLLDVKSVNTEEYVRALVATPLLVFSDRLLALTTGMCARRLVRDGLVPPAEAGRHAHAVWRLQRAWGFGAPEVVFALASVVTPGRSWHDWATVVLFRFFALRLLWRWGVWGMFCARLSRLHLGLAANHPDRAGGLSFLRLPSLALGLGLAGCSSVIAAATPQPAGVLLIGSVTLIALAIAFTPPILLFGILLRGRTAAVAAYGRASLQHGRWFHRQIEEKDLESDVEIGASEQTDFGSEVERVLRMRVVPFGRDALVVVALPIVLPFVVRHLGETGLDAALIKVGLKLIG